MKFSRYSLLPVAIVTATTIEIPDVTQPQGFEIVKDWARNLASVGEAQFKTKFPDDIYYPSPEYWGDLSVYEVFVDRFNNGNPDNDRLNLPSFQKDQTEAGDLYDIHEYRQGGDIKGIMDRLDYIQDLGMKSIWVTPIFENLGGQYHGYCVSNFLKIDPGFGTLEEFQQLVKEAHKRDIRVILDIVINHMCNPDTAYETQLTEEEHQTCANDLRSNDWNGYGPQPSAEGELQFSDNFFAAFKTRWFFNRCGTNSGEDTSGSGAASVYGDFVDGMFDFNTQNWDFQEIFTNIHKYWIAATDVDGFRLDAAKHVSEQFISHFAPEIRAYANSLGKDDFYLVGEVAAAPVWQGRFNQYQYVNPVNPWEVDGGKEFPNSAKNRINSMKSVYMSHPKDKYPGLNAVYDFAHSGNARDALRKEKSLDNIQRYLYSPEHRSLDGFGDAGLFWNNLEIHDWPRFLAGNYKDNFNVGILAQAYLILARGMPILYYGAEQGFNGNCHWDKIATDIGSGDIKVKEICQQTYEHALFRQTMWKNGGYNLGSAIGDIANQANIGRVAANEHTEDWENDPFLNRDHEMYKSIRALEYIRNSCVPIKRGTQVFRQIDESIIAYSRIHDGVEILVVLNPSNDQELVVPDLEVDHMINAKGRVYKNLVNSKQKGIIEDVDLSVKLGFDGKVTLGPNEYAVFVPIESFGKYDAKAKIYTCRKEPIPCNIHIYFPFAVGGAALLGGIGGGLALKKRMNVPTENTKEEEEIVPAAEVFDKNEV